MRKFLLILAILTNPAFAGGGGGWVGGATEVTQLMNNGELVTQVANSAQQVASELQMYQTMYQNIQNIPNQVWGNITQDIGNLQTIVAQGQAISYAASNIDQQFQQRYPGYTPPAGSTPSQYQQWSQGSLDSIRGALDAANLQASQFQNEQATMSTLQNMSQTSVGRMQALQVGNQIAVQQVQQLQKLRQMQMAQIQAQGNYEAAQVQNQSNDMQIQQQVFGPVAIPQPGTHTLPFQPLTN